MSPNFVWSPQYLTSSIAATRTDDERTRGNDRYGRRGEDFLSSRRALILPDVHAFLIVSSADRVSGPPREDLPLPTQPPYTAFIGNLAFDLTEIELEEYFGPAKVTIILQRFPDLNTLS
jgi:translation initiation factor 4B